MEVYIMENNENTSVNETVETTETQGAKTYTEQEVLALIQSETDKRVTQALKTQQKKHEKELSLSKLDGEERIKAEQADRIAELEQLVASMNIERNKSELKSVLSSRGLSAEFADIITITDDIAESQKTLDKLDKLFKAAVKAEVEKRLAGNAPRGNSGGAAEITKETAKKMSIAELAKLKQTNPELYNNLYN